jgi:hypothetical protein
MPTLARTRAARSTRQWPSARHDPPFEYIAASTDSLRSPSLGISCKGTGRARCRTPHPFPWQSPLEVVLTGATHDDHEHYTCGPGRTGAGEGYFGAWADRCFLSSASSCR